MYANNKDVAFGDVVRSLSIPGHGFFLASYIVHYSPFYLSMQNLSEEQVRGNHNPGAGGWPTIKYFNEETGVEGKAYTKKTSGAMCDELGNEEYMNAYVEEAGNTVCFDAEINVGRIEYDQLLLRGAVVVQGL